MYHATINTQKEQLCELTGSVFKGHVFIFTKIKSAKPNIVSIVCYISYKKERAVRKCIHISSFMQNKHVREEPEMNEICCIQGFLERLWKD